MPSDERSRALEGLQVAVLATDGFEQIELLGPLEVLEGLGAEVTIVSLPGTRDSIRAWDHDRWGESVVVDTTVHDYSALDFDALVLPGGMISIDRLRTSEEAVAFVRGFIECGKPVGALCHAVSMLVEAGVGRGRRLTSARSLRTDLRNSGAEWVDAPVVVDRRLVTCREVDGLDAFVSSVIATIQEGVHDLQAARVAR